MAQDWRTPNGLRIFGGMATRGLLTLPQVASRLHVSESTDRNRIERVSFPPFESGTARWLRSAWTRTSSSFGFSRLLRRSHPLARPLLASGDLALRARCVSPGSTTARGYGHRHQVERKRWAPACRGRSDVLRPLSPADP